MENSVSSGDEIPDPDNPHYYRNQYWNQCKAHSISTYGSYWFELALIVDDRVTIEAS